MKKKIFSFAICLCMVLACIVGFVGCGSKLSYEDAYEKTMRIKNVMTFAEALGGGDNASFVADVYSAMTPAMGVSMALSELIDLENGEWINEATEIWQKTKNGYIYAHADEVDGNLVWQTTKYVITRKSDSIKIVSTGICDDVTQEGTATISFAKNYLKAETTTKVTPKVGDATTTTSTFEWRKSGNKEYIQGYTKEGETQEVFKAQYTVKTENVEATKAFNTSLKYDKVSIISYDIKSETVTVAPVSLKNAKLATFIVAGEGVTSWKAV